MVRRGAIPPAGQHPRRAGRSAFVPLIVLGLAAAGAPTAGAAAVASVCPTVPGLARTLPTAQQTVGRSLTAAPLSPGEVDRLLLALDRASPRIRTAVAGRTPEGRPLRYAIVGDPRAIAPAALARTARNAQAIRAGATDVRSVARAAVRPALTWIGAGVHANEPSGPTAALALLRRLAGTDSCAVRRVLRGTTAIVVPDQNPDGRARGTRTNAAGIDLNRDWFAASQPETTARLQVLGHYPPVVAIDVHEQGGSSYFTPPYAAPIVGGLPAASRQLADGVVRSAVDRALGAIHAPVRHRSGYDLLYPGYADSATSLLFGSGGMTFEQGSDPSLAVKTRRQETAIFAALGAVAQHRRTAIRAWANGFAVAQRAGQAGRAVNGGRAPVFGWALRTDRYPADADALAERLRVVGVRVQRAGPSLTVRADPLGPAPTRSVRLPAGTIVVPAAQPLVRWASVLLGRDADEAGTASADTDSWSLPRLAGIEAEILRSRPPAGTLLPYRAAVGPAAPLVAPSVRVVQIADPSAPLTGPPTRLPAAERPSGWLTQALHAAKVPLTTLTGGALAGGVPAATTHLLLGPGPLPSAARTTVAREAINRFVRAGGTVIALGAAGIASARRAGISAVETTAAASPQAVNVVAMPGADPRGRTLGGPTWVVVAGEPRLTAPPGATAILRAGAGAALAPSGPAGAAVGLSGRPLVIEEPQGAGRTISVGFSPVFRRQSAAGERLLWALLRPASG